MLIQCNNVSVLPEISSEEMRFQQLQGSKFGSCNQAY